MDKLAAIVKWPRLGGKRPSAIVSLWQLIALFEGRMPMEPFLALLVSFGWVAAETATDRYARIFQTVRNFEVAETKALADEYVSEDATLEFPNYRLSDPARRRLWRNVPSGGVRCDTQVLRMTIVAVQKRDATVDTEAACKVQYASRNGFGFSGVTSRISDRLQLKRVGNAWRIVSVTRRIRETGSDAAWHRRNP